MLHHGHAGEQTLEKKKKREPARAYQFGNTVIVEDEDGEVIMKYEIPPDRSKQSEKPAVSEKIRHRLARMGSYLGISHEPQGQQPQAVTAHKQHPMPGELADLREVLVAASSGTGQKKGKILYGFVAQGFNEVTVSEGDEVVVLNDGISDDWWMVRLLKNGREGYIPANYVEVSQTTNLDQHPRIFDEDDILDTRYIPWDRFPDISRLRVFSNNHLDRGDGERFTADELDHVKSLLFHACRDLSRSRGLTDDQTRQITHLGGMGRICLILDLIEQRQLLRNFIRLKIADDSLPLLLPILQGMLDPHKDGGRAAELFFTEQFRAVSRDWSDGTHHVMHRREALPFRPLRSIGFGSQGSIDEVQLPNTEGTCARKRWIAGANLQKITARFDDEVKIIKKVAVHPHILELLASYTRGREFGLFLPVADCDLWHILTMNPLERGDVISNQGLIQSWGCLSSGLLFMHDKGIKHKDIKPQNIVLRGGDFQFTDFGLSKDISDLSHSATDGADRGTFRYMAPEVTEYQPQGRSADVFSLACVLFEIFSVWRGFSVDDADSFSALAPFHKNLSAIHSWIRGFAPIAPMGVLQYKKSTHIFVSMFTHKTADRPHLRDLVFKMTMISYPRDLFCDRCLDVALRGSDVP